MTEPTGPHFEQFTSAIKRRIPQNRRFTDPLRLLAWGTDAGFYRYLPKMILIAKDADEVSYILSEANRWKVPLTFRAAGTSLSGQAVSDSVLVVAGKGWEKYVISPDATTITLEPGIIGDRVNQLLAPYGRIFSPDPASKKSAMVGGIIINNASGMNCGTHANSDREILSAKIILTDGSQINTADADALQKLGNTHHTLLREICAIRDEIRADKDLCDRIRHKYSIKNVMGLNLLPFVMFENPMEIIAHLMVGSEGTLAFLAEATLKTEHLYPHAASAMLYFQSMEEACRCVVALKKGAPVFSCEMLDKKSLASVNDTTGEGLTALLIDTKADSSEELQKNIGDIMKVVEDFELYVPANFSTDPAVTGKWWNIRSGVFPAVGGTRPVGSSCLIEDVAFHIDDLPRATTDLANLLEECGYDDACIYGHALEGNYHFIIAQKFDNQADVDRYKNLMQRIVELVIDKYDGSLKAEHGVGRNMAPFVKREWGEKAYSMMLRLKKAFDPNNILNRGSMFNDDPECYIKHIKPLPEAHEIIDKCIECGFCEVNCMSCGFTLSARQRIVTLREIARLKASGTAEDLKKAHQLERGFKYLGNQTCAGDGLCSTSCPMKINTGEMVHVVREIAAPKGSMAHGIGKYAADHLAGVSSALNIALDTANLARNIVGNKAVDAIGRGFSAIGLPMWSSALPKGFRVKKSVEKAAQMPPAQRKVVYFPSCINQTMGITPEPGKKIAPLVDVMLNLCQKAGYEVIFPEGMEHLCCGLTWESKGMPDIADAKSEELEKALVSASENGRYPIMCDQSPCLHRMRQKMPHLRLYEPVEFINDFLAEHLEFTPTSEPVAIHVTCSSRHMGLADKMLELARKCSTNVTLPAEVGCCGFAGDKGFNLPELNRWGLRKLKPELLKNGVKTGYSNSRTCEIGLTTNSGIPYKSIAYLVDQVTTKK